MKKFIFCLIFLLVIVCIQKSLACTAADQQTQSQRDTTRAHLQKAMMLTRQGNTVEASKIYIGIIESEPDNREAVQGWLMANMKRSPTGEEDAIKSLEELNKAYPKNTGIIFFKAFLEAEYNHNEEALKDIDKLISIQPDTAVNYVLKGQALSAMGKHDESFKAFDRATTLDPKRFDVWGMKAGELAKIGRFDEAILSADKGLDLAPNNPTVIYNRACIYSLKGDKANALADLKKAISMNPSFKEYARKDEDFKSLFNDEDFKKLTL
jgi:tetratricopeptide (TPR) repeat protein